MSTMHPRDKHCNVKKQIAKHTTMVAHFLNIPPWRLELVFITNGKSYARTNETPPYDKWYMCLGSYSSLVCRLMVSNESNSKLSLQIEKS